MPTAVIYCPSHWGLTSQKKRRQRIKDALDATGLKYDFVQSETSDSVTRLMNMMIANGYHTIIVCGGDSALNDAVNCLMRTDSGIRGRIRLGIIPNGVMNDYASFWGLPRHDIALAADTIRRGRVRRVDVGCMRYTDRHRLSHTLYFIDAVNVGLVASIQNLRHTTRRILGSRTLSYISSAFLLLTQRLSQNMHITIDGQRLRQSVMTLCAGNATGYGQTPSAVPYNGMLDITVVAPSQMRQTLTGVRLALSRRFLMHHGVQAFRTQSVTIHAPNADVAVDGRVVSSIRGEFTLTVIPETLNLIIP